MCPIKGMGNKYAYLAERCTSLLQLHCHFSPSTSSLSSMLLFLFPPSPPSFFIAAIVSLHHIIGWKGTLTHRWLSRSSTWFDRLRGPPPVPLGCKTTVEKLVLWVHASALCMFMSNIWNKWHPLAGTTQINLVNTQAKRAAQATEKEAYLTADRRSACIIQLIPERGTFYAAFTTKCTHGTHTQKHTYSNTNTGTCVCILGKDWTPLPFCQIKYTVRAS